MIWQRSLDFLGISDNPHRLDPGLFKNHNAPELNGTSSAVLIDIGAALYLMSGTSRLGRRYKCEEIGNGQIFIDGEARASTIPVFRARHTFTMVGIHYDGKRRPHEVVEIKAGTCFAMTPTGSDEHPDRGRVIFLTRRQ